MKTVSAAIILMSVALVVLSPDSGRIEAQIVGGSEPSTVSLPHSQGSGSRASDPQAPPGRPGLATAVVSPVAAVMSHEPPEDTGQPVFGAWVRWAAYDGTVMVPAAFDSPELYRIIECESRGLPLAVGKAGELGRLQVHPIHGVEMEKMGLSYASERDRVAFAVILWRRSGWTPWACSGILRELTHDEAHPITSGP